MKLSTAFSDHVEVIPRLSVEHVAIIFRLFRDNCLKRYADIRFPVPENQYQERIDAGDIKRRNEIMRLLNVRVREEIDSITAVIDNPRNFKHILRRTNKAWNSLHGEIDFDDLFVANVLRVAAPEAFNFVHENLPEIRWLQPKKEEDRGKERQVLHENLAKVCSFTGSKLQAINELIRILFPYWPSPALPGMRSPGGVIQGVWEPDPTDYWDRLIREQLDGWEISDQAVAKAIEEWKRSRDSAVYKGLPLARAVNEVPGFAKKVLQFGDFFDGPETRVLTSQLFDIVFRAKGVTDRDFLGRNELHQLVVERSSSGHGDWIVEEVGKLFAFNLSVVTDTYTFWFQPTFFEGEAEAKRVRNVILEKGKSSYSDRSTFVDAIRDAKWNAVRDFVITMTTGEYGGTNFDPEEWTWLANVLLDTAGTDGRMVVPQMLGLAITQAVVLPNSPLVWSQESVRNFFQDRERDVMVLLSNIDPDQFDEPSRKLALFARDRAGEWLAKGQETNGQTREKTSEQDT